MPKTFFYYRGDKYVIYYEVHRTNNSVRPIVVKIIDIYGPNEADITDDIIADWAEEIERRLSPPERLGE